MPGAVLHGAANKRAVIALALAGKKWSADVADWCSRLLANFFKVDPADQSPTTLFPRPCASLVCGGLFFFFPWIVRRACQLLFDCCRWAISFYSCALGQVTLSLDSDN